MQTTPKTCHHALALLLVIACVLAITLPGQSAAAASTAFHSTAQVVTPQDAPIDGCTSDGHGRETVEWEGTVVSTPADGYVGAWVIELGVGEQKNIVVDCATEIRDFGPDLPPAGTWIKVRGFTQDDGSLRATRLRPDDRTSNQVVVSLKSGVDVEQFAGRYGLKIERRMPLSTRIYLFTTTDDENIEHDRIEKDSESIDWVEYNLVSQIPTGNPFRTWHWGSADDTGYVNQNAFAVVNLDAAGRYLGDKVEIAVLDTGIDIGHPAFAQSLDILAGSDMVANDDSPADVGPGSGWGHGTHVAGIIHRIAPNSQIMPVRVLDANGRGNAFVLAYAIEWAAMQGAEVINLSLGADCGSRLLNRAIPAATAKRVVIVAAAGNDNADVAQCPASLPAVIGVTAINEDGSKADFANYGDWVDLAAPGVGITSTVPAATGFQYAAWSGTSMAAPFVSGAAALARQKFPKASSTEVAALLTGSGGNLDPDDNSAYAHKLGRLLNIGSAVADVTPLPDAPNHLYIPLVIKR
jgi:thermitase